MGHLVGLRFHPHGLQHLADAPVGRHAVLPSGRLQHEGEVVLHRTVRQQLEILENHPQFAAQERDFFRADGGQVVPADRCGTFAGPVLGNHGPDDGSLAGSHLSYDVHEVAFFDLHIHPVDDNVLAVQDIGSLE